VAAAAGTGHPGEPWQVPKFYWTVMARTAVETGMRELADLDLPAEWIRVSADDFAAVVGAVDDAEVDAVVEAPESRAAKIAALRAHATQVTVEPDGRACTLSNNVALPIPADEYYVLVEGTAGPRDGRGWETDLLAGVNLG
jgi:N-acetyl-1-D-myo-inositol-2-amino-2-deoxy-alpha-D-glucopyranoside deacetylase